MHTFALALALLFSAAPAAAQYRVSIEPSTHQLLLELDLATDLQYPIEVATRGTSWGLQSQVRDVECGKTPLDVNANGAWIVPPGCSRISWTVVPDAISDGEADPSKQRTLAVGTAPWFLLAEPTSLLRPVGVSGASTIGDASACDRLVGATPAGAGRFEVPAANHAPEFYVLGRAATVRRHLHDVQVIYVADDPDRVKRLGLDQLHASALSYLSAIVGHPKGSGTSSPTLLVIWLAAQNSRGPLGGAAGSRSFVANYVIDPSTDEKHNRAMTLAITAHEQFHQLVDMVRRQAQPLPAWLGESLAQYYGLKALLHAEDSKSSRAVFNEFVDPARTVSEGLLELNRRYLSGDRSVYRRFYTQGATLWNAVDSRIVAATGGRQSLDDYLDDLLASRFSADGALPKAFIERLRSAGGLEVDRIVQEYVGQ